MNVRERLKEAYDNVCFDADQTWTDNPSGFHRNNLELYLTENYLQRAKLERSRPRSVRESIPRSRLAKYADYPYNEAREMSYAHSTSTVNMFPTPQTQPPIEPWEFVPWEIPEVEELFRWFLKDLPEDNFSSHHDYKFESPLLTVNEFEEKILKIKITEDRVKHFWKAEDSPTCDKTKCYYKSSEIVIKIYATPTDSFVAIANPIFKCHSEQDEYHERFRRISTQGDFEQLQQLGKCFQDYSSTIRQYLSGNIVSTPTTSTAEAIPTEVLYSEVLQGKIHKKVSSSVKSEPIKVTLPALSDDSKSTSSTSQDNFTSFTVLNNQRSVYSDEKHLESCASCHSFRDSSSRLFQLFPQTPAASSRVQPQSQPSTSRYVPLSTQPSNRTISNCTPSFERYKNPPTSNRSSYVHPFSASYVQQTYVYSPIPPVQRWLPSYYPTQIFTSWFTQNPVWGPSSYENRPYGLLSDVARAAEKFLSDAQSLDSCDYLTQFRGDSLEIENIFEENPVSERTSEELEIQALEQYSNSNENFYQELERQAAEQYSNSPD